MTIEELFGTLQQSVVGAWRKHLRTSKYAKHMALDEFYTEMPEKVDALIEAWMGVNGRKPKQFDNLLKSKNMNTLDYLKSLKRVVKDGYELMNGENELEALLDDIAELIDSTLYKVKELSEHKMKSLAQFVNEAISTGDASKIIKNTYNDSNYTAVSCFNWLDELDWEEMSDEEYIEAISDINDDIDEDTFMDMYSDCMKAMAKIGRKKTLDILKKISTPEGLEDLGINL
jgi:DNA-binding ferritin-like protein